MTEFLKVAERLLEQEGRPMRPKELVDLAVERKLFSDKIAGKTPHQTMKSKLCVHVRRRGTTSIFVRTGAGKFFLRRLVDVKAVYDAPPQQKPEAQEEVLAFPNDAMQGTNRFQGIRKHWERMSRCLRRPNVCTYLDRLSAETNNNYKQVLTYILLTRRRSVLSFKRGSYNRVEDFLRGAHCIGFGGHVAKLDSTLFGYQDMGVQESAVRELFEELRLPSKDKQRLLSGRYLKRVGLLNDDSSPAGQRHFAFVFQYEVSDDPAWDRPERGEKSVTQLRWLSPTAGTVPIWDFEYWSQLCLREFFPWIAHAVPQYRIVRRVPLRPPHLLCVVGELGSGKSEATRLLKKEFNYKEVNTGRLVAELLGIPPVPDTPRDKFQTLAWDFINQPGASQRLAEAIWSKAKHIGGQRIIIDGIRQCETLELLRKYAPRIPIGVLFVRTLPDLAFSFFRAREGRGVSFPEFLRMRNAEVEQDVRRMIGLADAVLYNWIGRGEYQRAIRALVASVTEEQPT